MFYYYKNNGPFKIRQHVINHIDMILGLSKSEQKKENNDRIIALIDHEKEEFELVWKSDIPAEELKAICNKTLLESVFATERQQIIPAKSNGDCINFKEFSDEDDLLNVLDYSINQWFETDGSLSAFFSKTVVAVVILGWDAIVVDRVVVKRIPSEEEIQHMPIAINCFQVVSANYSQNKAWNTFSERICKNGHMKEYLCKAQNGICPVCGKPLKKPVVHHIDYDHICSFHNSGLDWQLISKKGLPDCEKCFMFHKSWFLECASRLRAVHNFCNHLIDQI